VIEVKDAVEHARTLLIEALNRQGVVVDAAPVESVASSSLPQASLLLTEVAQLTSAPFSEQARLILKVSHNLHASALPLLLAVRRNRAGILAGMQIQGELLRSLGVSVDQVSFGGAAGGARADMTTPRVTVQLLRSIAGRPYYKAFRRALPVLGVDGTLFNIATHSAACGSVQAKTGTYYVHDAMNDRRLLTSKALAGYMTTRRGRNLAFCVVVNNVHLVDGVSTGAVGEDLGQISAALQQAF
jgi:D-alanyl-D-alanine carboxypeptidase/D-alanyl-D-alanine-endopeptidase (penicillin-binding protein 4)